jgi:O-antigen/teichoic acid export membrane protein
MNKKLVFKNTFMLGISQFVNKLLLFLLTIVIARYLKQSGFGEYSLVITLVGFFNLFVNFGFGTISSREISKNRAVANKYFSNVFFLRTILSAVSFLFLFITIHLLGYKGAIATSILIYGVTLFTVNIIDTFTAVFNAFEKMEFMAAVTAALNAITLIAAVFVLQSGHGLIALVSVSAFAGTITVLFCFFLARKELTLSFSEVSAVFCKKMLFDSFPLMILGFLGILYFRFDIIILSKLKTYTDVGIYNASYKIMDSFMIVSNAVIGSMFPHMSRQVKDFAGNYNRLFRKLSLGLFFAGLLFSSIVFIFSGYIINLFYGSAFNDSVLPLKILIWAIPLIYINAALLYTLIAAYLQAKTVPVIVFVTIANFLLNLYYIPKFGYIGSSFITVASEVILFLGYYTLIRKKLSLSLL